MILFLFEGQTKYVYLVNTTSILFETSVLSYMQLKDREINKGGDRQGSEHWLSTHFEPSNGISTYILSLTQPPVWCSEFWYYPHLIGKEAESWSISELSRVR